MAYLWPQALVPWLDENGDPYSGAKAYFFDASTTTPQATYSESGLGEANDHPVVANSAGRFGAIFIAPGSYRVRITTADDVVISDIDGISVPILTDGGGGGGGDTPVELLARTGDIKDRWGTGSHSGWVRANGRTVGAAASGATERANADCEDLFLLLWTDENLTVSGGRGASAAGDWAANKNIALPDLRLRPRMGMSTMGGTASTILDGITVDGGADLTTLGAKLGVKEHVLTAGQMPTHDHGAATGSAGSHNHTVSSSAGLGQGAPGSNTVQQSASSMTTSTAPAHTHSIAPAGSNQAHPNVQPSVLVTVYIKL